MTSQSVSDSTIVRVAIYPPIGVARVGNSENEYFIGPEVVHPAPKDPGFYHDGTGALKRQAARFRVYGYNSSGEVVRELNAEDGLTWAVHVANKKSAWYEFQLALDIPEASDADPSLLRNAKVEKRDSLVVDPGERVISGISISGPKYAFDSAKFFDKLVYLGELETDETGRLIFLGGRGVSASVDGSPATTFANNDGWHDDTSDGSVRALVIVDGRTIEAEPAWVVVGPPNYGPDILSVRTMFDLMTDVHVKSGQIAVPENVSFNRDVLPLLQRLSGLQWVNYGFSPQFGWAGPWSVEDTHLMGRLGSAAEAYKELRVQVANGFRDFDRDGYAPMPWPWIYGDAMNVPPAKTAREFNSVTDTQLLLLRRWGDGDFVEDFDPDLIPPRTIESVPLCNQPDMLKEAAMSHCLADAFHPGCEMTWPMRHATMYEAPFRIRLNKGPVNDNYGRQLTPEAIRSLTGPLYAQSPGDITRWMAVPWQTDTASCRSGYYAGYGERYDPYLPTFWPARVPNQVLALEEYEKAIDADLPREERIAAFNKRASWFRRLGPGGYKSQINNMITNFFDMGVVESRPGVLGDPDFPPVMGVESPPVAPTIHEKSKRLGMLLVNTQDFQGTDDAASEVAGFTGEEKEDIVSGSIEKVDRLKNKRDR